MELTIDEQRLLAEFRKLSPSGKDELLAMVAALARRTGNEGARDGEGGSNQCRVKQRESHPETEKTPLFTE